MKIFTLLSWLTKWKFLNVGNLAGKLLPVAKGLVGEQFLAKQLHSYGRAKVIIKRVAIGLAIAIGVIIVLLVTVLVLLIIQLAR